MSDRSKISWTDATWNPVRGCTKVSAGCKHCYAETFAERWRGIAGHPFEQGFDLRLVPEKLGEPLKWKRPRKIFVNSMSDLFHEKVPDEFIDRVFNVMRFEPRHTFQILTKRADRMAEYLGGVEVPPNAWVGVSAEDQAMADARIPVLLRIPARVRWVSYEPALGPVDFTPWVSRLDWVVVGGESGPRARPFDVTWAVSVIEQFRPQWIDDYSRGAPVFIKQLGSRPFVVEGSDVARQWYSRDVAPMDDCGGIHTKHRSGADPAEWPEFLRVQQFPEAT